MKKLTALILAVIMLFSLTTVAAFAAGNDVTINFVVGGETVKTIEVAYGEDFNSQAPVVKTVISDGVKYKFGGWECDINREPYNTTIYEGSLPVIEKYTGAKVVTFTATIGEIDYDSEEMLGDIIGGDAVNLLKALIDQIVSFFQYIFVFLGSLFG